MVSAGALTIFSGKNIIIICGSETPAGVSEPLFHGWGRNGKRQLQRRFLRKRGAARKLFAETFSGLNPLRRSRASSPEGRVQLPQSSLRDASSLGEGAFGMVAQFLAKVLTLRACRSPLGELSRSD